MLIVIHLILLMNSIWLITNIAVSVLWSSSNYKSNIYSLQKIWKNVCKGNIIHHPSHSSPDHISTGSPPGFALCLVGSCSMFSGNSMTLLAGSSCPCSSVPVAVPHLWPTGHLLQAGRSRRWCLGSVAPASFLCRSGTHVGSRLDKLPTQPHGRAQPAGLWLWHGGEGHVAGPKRGDGEEHGWAFSIQERAKRWEDSRGPAGWWKAGLRFEVSAKKDIWVESKVLLLSQAEFHQNCCNHVSKVFISFMALT